MLNKNLIDDLVKKILNDLPQNISLIKTDLEQHIRRTISQGLTQFNLVSREEFDVQVAVLQRTREKLEKLQQQFDELEREIKP